MSRTRWEYRMVDGTNIEIYLKSFGESGWELVSVVWNGRTAKLEAYLKRQIED